MIVFYSWQSDLPARSNRSLIEEALQKACRELREDDTIKVQPVVDRDTQGASGAVGIAETIFEKIANADVFVADVSQIGVAGEAGRPVPNPNVLIELGFAMAKLGWEKIILVANTHFGRVEDLPFDLRGRRCLGYVNDPATSERAEARKTLEKGLSAAVRGIVAGARAADSPEQKYGLSSEEVAIARWVLGADDGSFFTRCPLERCASALELDVSDVRAWTEHLATSGFLKLEAGTLGSHGRALCGPRVFELAPVDKQREVETDATEIANALENGDHLSWGELERFGGGVRVRVGHAVRLLEAQGLVRVSTGAEAPLAISGVARTSKLRREFLK